MKKTLALILTLALSLAALTGCGSKTETPADTNTDNSAQTEAPATLSGSVSTNGSTSMEKVIGALSEQFMADNSGVTVTYDPTGSGAGIETASNGSADRKELFGEVAPHTQALSTGNNDYIFLHGQLSV